MPHYFTHLYNSDVLCDTQGEDFADLGLAEAAARRTASELIAEHIIDGQLIDLSNRLEVVDNSGRTVFVLRFSDLILPTEALSVGPPA